MVEVNTTHKLTDLEKRVLRLTLGRTLEDIISPGVRIQSGSTSHHFMDAVNMRFDGLPGFITITTDFSETAFGDDFMDLRIQQLQDPAGIQRHPDGPLMLPFADFQVSNFIVDRIEVHGYSYEISSENNKPEAFWGIERSNPGKPVKELIETENILVFFSGDRTMMIESYGPMQEIGIFFDEMPYKINNLDKVITRLKYVLDTAVNAGEMPIKDMNVRKANTRYMTKKMMRRMTGNKDKPWWKFW